MYVLQNLENRRVGKTSQAKVTRNGIKLLSMFTAEWKKYISSFFSYIISCSSLSNRKKVKTEKVTK